MRSTTTMTMKMTMTMKATRSKSTMLLIIIMLVVGHSNPITAAAAAASSSSLSSSAGIITFPLIPHHVQRARRGLTTEDNELSQRREGDYKYKYDDDDDEEHNLRRRRGEDDSSSSSSSSQPQIMGALYQGYGTHYVDLWCGTPPQRQTVIVDTGSAQTAFPCGGCDDCGSPDYHIDAYFEHTESISFQTTQCANCSQRATCSNNMIQQHCEIFQSYSEGSSWEAFEAMDTCYIGGFHNTAALIDSEDNTNNNNNGDNDNNNNNDNDNDNDSIDPNHAKDFGFPLRFGCQTLVTGLFKTQMADGIMGMCDEKKSFWHQMYRAHKIQEKLFSLCYTRPPSSLTSRNGTEAGALTLGGTDKRLHDKSSPMVYSTTIGTSSEPKQNRNKSGYFDIHIRKLYLRHGSGGESAKTIDESAIVIKLQNAQKVNDNGGVIVDSGTTDTYFSRVIQTTLRKNWKTLASSHSNSNSNSNGNLNLEFTHDAVELTHEQLLELPTILIQMAGDTEMNQIIVNEFGGGDSNKIAGLAGTDFDPEYPLDVIVAVPPTHYMERLHNNNNNGSSGSGKYMNRVYDTETDGNVLGANVMMGHDVLVRIIYMYIYIYLYENIEKKPNFADSLIDSLIDSFFLSFIRSFLNLNYYCWCYSYSY